MMNGSMIEVDCNSKKTRSLVIEKMLGEAITKYRLSGLAALVYGVAIGCLNWISS